MKLSRLRHDSRLQRRFVLGLYGGLALVVLAATAAVIDAVSSSSAVLTDRLGEAGDVLAGGTLLLAGIAALVALHAYANVTGLPDLKFQIRFPGRDPNSPMFQAAVREGGLLLAYTYLSGPSEPLTRGTISVRNVSGYSAKNPAVVVRLHEMAFVSYEVAPTPEWAVIGSIAGTGVTEVQWDGGPTYSIHGRSTRTVPELDFGGLCYMGQGEPSITFELLAESYRREITIPVGFKVDSEFKFAGKEGAPAWL